jgi:hypothetical protein
MYTILLFLLTSSGALTLAYGVRVLLDRRKPKPIFPDRREGHRRRIIFKIPARLIFTNGPNHTDIPIGYHLLEDEEGAWIAQVGNVRATLTDPSVIRKLWADDMIEVDFLPIVPIQTATVPPTPEIPPPAPAPTPVTPHDALLVTTSVTITEADNTTREVPTGCVLLRRSADGPWEVVVGDDVLTLRDNVVQRGLLNGWFQHMSSMSDLEERTVRRHMDALLRRTILGETLLGVGTSLTDAVRSMANMNRNINQPGMFSLTTTTVTSTQPAPPKPQREPDPPSSAIDQILADDE